MYMYMYMYELRAFDDRDVGAHCDTVPVVVHVRECHCTLLCHIDGS